MTGIQFKVNLKTVIYLIVFNQVIVTSCSKKVYPGTSHPGTEKTDKNIGTGAKAGGIEIPDYWLRSPAEYKLFADFRETGSEKPLNTSNASAGDIIETSREFLGVPHCMGGTTRRCIDCSGLLLTVFASHGIALPHNSEEQARYGKIIPEMENLRKGDLVFFTRSYNTRRFITHSGIYLGDHLFIHTSSSKGVTITSLFDPWWRGRFVFGTRIFDH
jgi:murein DD-endopeptidase / murein LD-carboxypeptidase